MTLAGDSPTGVPASRDAGTPFALPGHQTDQALVAVEFEAVLDLVAAHASGPMGAARVQSRRPSGDLPWIREELAQVDEAASLIRRSEGISPEPVPDLAAMMDRLRVPGSVLEGKELAALHRVLKAGRLVAAELRRVEDDAPRVARLLAPVPPKFVERRLELALDSEGGLLDTASPSLAAARGEVRAARARLIQKLEALLRGMAEGNTGAVTIRNGRYVIPVPRDSRGRLGGIVHDESASGGTLFIEPTSAIELGNGLRAAEAREDRETLRVYRELTELLRAEHAALAGCYEMCVAVDDLVARARYAAEHKGQAPRVEPDSAALKIVRGYHPLLLAGAQGAAVVPFDLEFDVEERTVLLSGPNTGGKTVLLKAVGLTVALTQSGIIPPVGSGTTLPVFQRLFADIGDRQSIAASLSTFSAHVAVLRRILAEADDHTLVLLDEIGSGTDPAEGAALAAAALRSLTQRRTITLATTHLGALKQLAVESSGIVNASLQFDAVSLRPTYQLEKGVPGRSYGLAIARRLGIDEDVLADAEAQIPDAERSLDALLAVVERRARDQAARDAELNWRAEEVEARESQLAQQAAAQTVREAELAALQRRAERDAREKARAYLLEARQRVEQAIGMARAAVDEVTAREARRLVEEGIKAEAEALGEGQRGRVEEGQRGRGAEGEPVTVGSRVRLPSGAAGHVVDVRSDGRLVIAVGAVKLVADPGSVESLAATEGGRHLEARAARTTAPLPLGPPAPLELDLRGLTGEEAEQALMAALDAAVLAEQPYLRIIHGKGTGVLRERVQRVVADDRRIAKSGFAPANQGGTGVTVVEFEG